MSKLTDLVNSAKHLVIEDDAPAAAAPTKPLANVPHPAFNLPSIPAPTVPTGAFAAAPALGSPFSSGASVVLDENVYKSVKAKTDFNVTPVGKAVKKYYDALEGVIADDGQRFRAAIGQAQKIDGVTPDQVLATFDQMQAALDRDAQEFANVAAAHEKQEITTRQQSIATKQQQVTQLNSEIAQLSTELADETTRSGNAVTQHTMAQQRRAQEIAADKARVQSLLGR